ncbi:uroporphyrinogen-III C-methyltransferase [Stenotrophomonas rhizophila]|uniref:uroporphyrinogen-III C-methyltransferase n=1 Tax=Stenotrophomonas rhizophila TaxID=216778 RepID=UPI001E455A7C|nr:uroporphyrinogen-III C-methyltransferase [Stenotrophomonas rhizophila]MCC7633182.1 uroporphyrinogen-III C-methyltransferase [Stenotrophomonas rhizophila]MCC7662075.1 uroporphyrinogen-III C-methyltransferase [Stenotrophomonas rhizophila]
MNDAASPAAAPTPLRWIVPLALLAVVAGGVAWGWTRWQAEQARSDQRQAEASLQLQGLVDSVDALRRDQRSTAQRLQDAAATNRVLRDEMLGLSQRSALLEDNLAKLADSTRHGAQALQLEEAELLLAQAAQRLAYADDVDGAKRLYALAASALDDVQGNDYLNLRQALMQERNAVDSLGPGVRATTQQQLGAFAKALQQLPDTVVDSQADGTATPWWQQILAPFVTITPTRTQGPLTDAERMAAWDGLQLELTLARAATERGDQPGYTQALDRVALWLPRLWPDSPALRARRVELQQLRTRVLHPALPELGSTLQQLRSMRDGDTR